MNLMNNENTIAKLVAQNFGYANPNLSDIKKSIRYSQYKLAAAVRVCDAYYDRTGERRNSYSRKGYELSENVSNARRSLVAALGLENNETVVRRLVNDAIVSEFYNFVRVQREYREEFRNCSFSDETKRAETTMASAYHNYQAALVVAMMEVKEKPRTAEALVSPQEKAVARLDNSDKRIDELESINRELIAALKVIQLSPNILGFLTTHEPMAYDQVRSAIRKAEGK